MRTLHIAPAARRDIFEVLRWSHQRFGPRARVRYRILLEAAFDDLARDPTRPGVGTRPGLPEDLKLYHVRHSRRGLSEADRIARPRHFLAFRFDTREVLILRVLHDAMELAEHLVAP